MTVQEIYSIFGETRYIASLRKISYLDLDILLSAVLHQPNTFLYSHPDYQLTKSQEKKLNSLIQRRQQGEPIAYIIGEKEFFGLPFKVNHQVLIPRPDTEHLVELVLGRIKPGEVVCDVGTGSGNIAISLKRHFPKLKMIATDISKPAVMLAKQNAKLNKTKIQFFVGDVLQALPPNYLHQLDWIIFNAPYLTKTEASKTNLAYEPQLALTPHGQSTTLYQQLIQQAPTYLAPNGKLVFEIGYRQAKRVQQLIVNTFPKAKIEIIKDYGGFDRVVYAETMC